MKMEAMLMYTLLDIITIFFIQLSAKWEDKLHFFLPSQVA